MDNKIYTGCPKCNAQSEDDAADMCVGADDCVMCHSDDWQESLDYVNKIASLDNIDNGIS